jgi:hypothetical protein
MIAPSVALYAHREELESAGNGRIYCSYF